MKKIIKYELLFQSEKQLYIWKGDIMDNLTLLETLKSKSMTFSLEEIQEIMDEELNKNPEEMDTELIDLCAEILDKVYFNTQGETAASETESKSINENTKKNSKGIKFRKVLLIAAIFIIITSIAIPVSARYVHNETSDKIVHFFSDHFKIDLRSGNKNAISHSDENIDIVKNLNDAGFESIILPSDLLKNDYAKDDISISKDESYLTAEIDFKMDNDISGYISIIKHRTTLTEFAIGQEDINDQYDSVKQITVNGMDILVFNHEEKSHIEYVDNNIEYSIFLDKCSFDSAIKIAESL